MRHPSYCPKCGSMNGWMVRYLPPKAVTSINGPDSAATGECLIVRCRTCDYEFTEPVAEAA